MSGTKKMQTVHIPRPRIVKVTRSLENIFERLAEELKLDIYENKIGLDVLRDSEVIGDKFNLGYQRILRDTNLQDEGLIYSGRLFGKPLEIYVDSYFRKPSLSYTIPSDQLAKYRLFLVNLSGGDEDAAMRLALGSWLPDHRNKKQIFQNVDLPDFSEIYDFLRRHIKTK